ncbi:MAG: hydroxymethylglutaryl-CoA reductase (NADPH) [Candidatus Woesearchaeota archaeon]|nr:hydroxymethylglutaryl-CoA reductase (NADPH) [Candidatus Woesearchaeota archaeon]
MATNSGLLDRLMKGEVKMHELDDLLPPEEAQELRLLFIEKKHGFSLPKISSGIIASGSSKSNIENMIGSVQVPLGMAGPIRINGENARGDFFLPLATTEGALVASVNRGCHAINSSGGAEVVVLSNAQARSILFKAESVKRSKEFSLWVESNFSALKKIGEEGERFLEILDIVPYVIGLNIYLRIKASTSDAMGMNMITFAGKRIADYIVKDQAIRFISESGNLCVDKKPAAINLIESRGKRVLASVNLSEEVIKKVLKTDSRSLIDMNYRKNLLGSAASGSMGFNAHFANIIAAMFLSTGQDMAHVVDGSLGFTLVEEIEHGVNFSVTIPSLQVGTVGGGTGLPTQKECLMVLGCFGSGSPAGTNSLKLAEVVASAVLAGEISLLAALCTKDLSRAHKELNH